MNGAGCHAHEDTYPHFVCGSAESLYLEGSHEVQGGVLEYLVKFDALQGQEAHLLNFWWLMGLFARDAVSYRLPDEVFPTENPIPFL